MTVSVRQLKQLKQMSEGLKNLSNVAKKTQEPDGVDPYWQGYYSHKRHPMIVTTKKWMKQDRYIVFAVNPKDMAWSLPRRESVSKTAAGAIRNTWRNRFRGTYYDEGTLNVTFQTGNLLPGSGIPEELFGFRDAVEKTYFADNRFSPEGIPVTRTKAVNSRRGVNADAVAEIMRNPPIPTGLRNFYDFLEMVDQPMLANIAGGENRHIILYRSRVFPMMRLEGYFTGEPISFSESADGNANKLEWTSTFQIYRSSPPWWKSDALQAAYIDAIRTFGGMSEIYPAGFDSKEFQKWWNSERKEDLTDPNLPYTKVSTSSKKKPGLVDKSSPKTAAKSGELKQSPQAVTRDRLFDSKKLLNSYKEEGQPGVNTPSFLQTEYGQELSKAMALEFDKERASPATKAEIENFMASWIRENTPNSVQASYDTLLHRLENP